jgi:hypothetical protein
MGCLCDSLKYVRVPANASDGEQDPLMVDLLTKAARTSTKCVTRFSLYSAAVQRREKKQQKKREEAKGKKVDDKFVPPSPAGSDSSSTSNSTTSATTKPGRTRRPPAHFDDFVNDKVLKVISAETGVKDRAVKERKVRRS